MKNVTIGDNILIASHIYILDNYHGRYKGGDSDSSPDTPPVNGNTSYRCNIEDNVWIGKHVVVLPGVTIYSTNGRPIHF